MLRPMNPDPTPSPMPQDFPDSWRTISVNGLQFEILIPGEVMASSQDYISESLRAGIYPQPDKPFIDFITTTVPKGGTVLDLGAHLGVIALAAAAAGYRVIAVEASPRNAAVLQASASRNHFDALYVVHSAVTDHSGIVAFTPDGPFGQIALPQGRQRRSTETVQVPAITVDELLRRVGCERVDFIKMDIEGAEVMAVRGMKQLLAAADAPPVLYEANGYTLGSYGQTPRDLKAAFEELGYRNYLVRPGSLVEVQASDFQPGTVTDYVAIKNGPALAGWTIAGPATRDEIAQEFLLNCSMAKTTLGYREHVIAELERAPTWLFARRDVRVALRALGVDLHGRVGIPGTWALLKSYVSDRMAAVVRTFQARGLRGVASAVWEKYNQSRANKL